MFTLTSNFARTGVIALGMLTGLGWPAMTAPLGRIGATAPPATSNFPIELAQSDRRLWRVPGGGVTRGGVNRGGRSGNWNGNRAGRGNSNWQGNGNPAWRGNGNRNWNGNGGRAWRNNGGNWRGNGNRNGRRWNNGNRYYDDYYDNSGVVLGLGLGMLGGYLGSGYYGGGYYGGGYYAGDNYPRRAYRAGSSHEQWCYGRYRSYRASDNTFQPYNGPRRQCNSPY